MDSVIVHAAMAEAAATGTPVAELSLDRIARRAGISRSTIYRRVRNRQALDDAIREAGSDPGSRVGVADRAIAAATEVITADGVAALTVDGVARRVGCSVSAVHTAFGGREGLLAAVFERHAPLPTVVQLMSEHPERFTDLEGGVRAIYTVVFDTVTGQQGGTGVLEALFAEVLAKPNGVAAQLLRHRILPRITANVGEWLTEQIHAGRCVDLPLSLLVPLLISPISVHMIARGRLRAAGVSVPGRQTVIDAMTAAFCNAVGTETQSR
ncbi:MAG TPA: TetR family transcriptional regulator [Mycobacterium sp.]|jgi:AcrR family transcriptional regulator|nr:TetR family transcriptional regulator [Mycobacterium sp.]